MFLNLYIITRPSLRSRKPEMISFLGQMFVSTNLAVLIIDEPSRIFIHLTMNKLVVYVQELLSLLCLTVHTHTSGLS